VDLDLEVVDILALLSRIWKGISDYVRLDLLDIADRHYREPILGRHVLDYAVPIEADLENIGPVLGIVYDAILSSKPEMIILNDPLQGIKLHLILGAYARDLSTNQI
jgi:hypothetical protein